MTKKKHIFGYVVLLGLAVSSLVSGQDRPSGSDTLWKPPGYAGKAPSSGARVLEKPSHGAQVFNGTRLTTSTEYRDRFETAWSPDNKWVAYGEEGEIYIVPVTGGGPINITANIDGWCSIPSFSPDGLEVIFSRYDGSEWTTYEIDAVNIKEKSLRLVLDLAVEGVLSHSGTYLACRALTGELVIYNTTNGDIKVINADDSSFGLLTFSPDDMFIVTSIANQDGISNLYRIPRDGGAAVQLTFNFFDTGYPEYSPDGKSIMYTGFPDIGRLYLYDFATGGSKQMFPEWEQEHICGSWSPEGKFISYLLDVDGTFEVFRILLPGNEPITQGGLADSAWPMSGQNLHHTGRGIASVAASSTLKWKFQTGREIYSAPTIGVDGTVYVGSNDTYLYAVKPDGMLKWKFQTGGDIASSPAIGADGTVYAGAWATDTYLYAVKSDGTLKWKFQTGGDITSSPAIGPDGTVYVGSGDKYLYAVNPDGTLKWKFQTGGGVGSPAIGPDGTVYAGSMDTYLYAITSEGTLKWKFWCVSGVSSSPAIDFDGTVYVGSSDRNLYAVNPDGTLKWKYQVGNYVYSPSIGSDGTVYVGSLDKYLYAVKPDGTLKWKFQTGGVVLSSPAIGSGGIVYIGSEDKYLYAVKPDGTLKWKFQTGAEVASSPAIDSDGTVYVGSKDGYLYAFAPEIPGAGTITVTSPNGGEFFFAGQTVPITWETSGVSELYLEYSTDNGANWTMIEGGVNAGAKSYAWTVPDASSKTCLVRISNSYDMSIQDVSNAAFTIRSPYLRIVTPNSAESWVIGSTQIITWEARDVAAITIELSVDNGAAWTLIAKNVDAMKKSYSWTIPNNPSDKCRVRITDESGSGIISSSYSAFTIKAAEQPVASVRVIAPNGGEVWTAGKAYKITWQSSNVKTVAIAYTSNDGTTWTVIATGVDATAAAYEWIIPDSPSTACRVRVIDESNSGVLGRSYANFTIVAPTGGLADSAWPMKGQNLQHTGRGIATVAASNTVKWKYRTGGNIFESSPVIGSDGTVYVESNDSYLNAVKSDGTLKWKFQTGQAGMSAGYASPAIGADGTVYVGSEDKYLYAVTSDGTLKWKFQAGGSLYASSPAIGSDGTVYVGSIDGYLYAVTSGGTLKWKFQTGNSIASSPAIGSDGTVYFGSGDGYLYAVTSDGTLKWKYQTGGQVQSSAAIGSDGTVYVGSHVWGSGSNTYLYAVKSDGTLKWKYQTGGQDWSSPAIGTDGTVYVGSWDTYLYALKSDGTLKWKYQTGGQVNSSPAIGTDGTVYFGSDDTNLYAVKSDGTLKWKYQFEGSIQSSPVIGSDGTIYVGSTKDLCLYAFALETSGTRILTIISPNGGEKLAANKTFAIIWEASNVKLITIEYSVNNGQNWMGVATQVNAEAGKYDWMVPETLSDNCLVRLINEADTSMIARSSAVFEILLPTAGIDPDASSAYTDPPDLYAGEKTTVVITLNDKDGNPVLGIPVTDIVVKVLGSNGTAEKVDLSFDKAQSDATGIIGVTFSSTVPGIKEIVVTVRGIELTTRPSVEFYEPFITVWYPNEFEEWQAGGEYDIWWESGGVKSVDIWFTPDSGIHWNVIAENVDASLGYFTWSIPANLDVPQCYISVGDSGNDQLYDNSDQAIAIVPSGQEAMISLSSPQGGENWAAGSSHVIRWNSSGVSNVKLEYTTDNGTNWTVIIASLPASAGTYAWTVPDTPSAQCLVRVSDAENADQNDASNAPFTIFRVTGEKSIELVSPVGGELWEAGKIYPIVWNAVNVTEVSIVYSINLGETWDIVKLRADANTGSFKWLIPDTVESDKCLIFVADSDSTEIGAMNQQPFTIFKGGQAPVVQVLAPNGGETVSADQPYEVRWNAVNVSRVRIDFSPNNGQTWTMLANDIAADTGRHTINFPFNRSNECLIKVSSMTDDTITDKSDGFFTLTFVSSITVEAPAAGDKWTVRSEQPIRWTLKGIKNVAIDYSTDGGTTWKEIVTDIDATLKVYRWTIPSDVSGTCKVRISDTSARDITAVSGVFSIVAGNFISVTSPSAGQTWSSGAQYEINWKFEGISKIKIELSTDGGNTWQEIAASVSASDGYYVWKVPEAESADCLIRLSDTSNSALSAQSDLFTIVKPVIQITHSPIAEAEENRELTFTAQVTSNTEIKEVMLYYDETGDRVFSSHLAMTSSGNNNAFSVTMTEGIFTALGMEYYITARDAEDKETRTPAGEGFYSITAVVKDIKTENPVTGGSVQTAYRMVSIPLELVKTSIVDQLSGKLPKGETGVDWRIYRYQPGSETPQEYPNTEGFAPGRAFWVIAKEKYELESPAGKTVTTAEPFKIELKSGWNDIANPWMFDISWSNIENPSGAELSVLYTYEGHWTDPTKPPTVMEPWKGYSVKNLSNRTVIIRLQPTRQSAGKAVVDANPSDWVLSIAAAAGQAVDSANHLGVRQDASAGWDRYDHVEPPAVGEYVSVLFPHRDWLQYPSDYTVDFRPPGETVMWDFDVKTNISRERVSVRLEGVDTLPEGCTIAITDRDSGKPVALNGDSFEFLSEKGITAHHYTLTVASGVRQERQDTAIQPERYVTATCYPNPFNPQTTIRYTLSTAGRVHITIFNSVGQRVRDYDMGFMGPGVHELVFDTAGLTSGIYLYRVDSGYASVTEKMLFMK